MQSPMVAKKTVSDTESSNSGSWKVLIVDDDERAHVITKMALKRLVFQGRPLCFTSAYTAEEARPLIQDMGGDLAVILLDVVMESSDAGLRLARDIREFFCNERVQIVLRTGNSNEVPEAKVLEEYAINCYLDKSNQSKELLCNIMLSSLSNYQQRSLLEEARLNERAMAEELAAQTQSIAKDKTDFLSYFLYHVRGPINTIHEVAQIFDESSLSEEDLDNLRIIEESSSKALQIAHDMLAYEQLNRGEADLNHIDFDLDDLVNDIVATGSAKYPVRSGSLTYNISKGAAEDLKGDPIRMKQTLEDALAYLYSIDDVVRIHLEVSTFDASMKQLGLVFTCSSASGSLPGTLIESLIEVDEDEQASRPGAESFALGLTQKLIKLMGGSILAVNKPSDGFKLTLSFPLRS